MKQVANLSLLSGGLAVLKKSKLDKTHLDLVLKIQWFTEIFMDEKIWYLVLLQNNLVGRKHTGNKIRWADNCGS